MDLNKDRYDINDLRQLMARLRDRDDGCPWDIEQDFESVKPFTIEEAYEVADAIERGSMDDLKDELGDLLFQIIFHAQMANEQDAFAFDDIVHHVTAKMIFRHPHVFGDTHVDSADDVKNRVWEEQKAKEKSKSGTLENAHLLDDVTLSLPSLLLANKIQKKVNKAGFEFENLSHVENKLHEELAEFNAAVKSGNETDIEDEIGDVLFCASLLARTVNIDAEEALRKANLKFIRRFNAMEDYLKSNGTPSIDTASIAEMSAAWAAIKNTEKP